jgi:hypothetical protein
MRSPEVDHQVNQIDQSTKSAFFRDPDRPPTVFVKPRQRQDIRIRRAKTRARTAAWRNSLDRLKRPEAHEIGMALVTALVTSPDLSSMTGTEVRFVTAALADLDTRGFDRDQVLIVLRRLKARMSPAGTSNENLYP